MIQYYLKARFHYNKDQFAELLLISAIAGAVSQVHSNILGYGCALVSWKLTGTLKFLLTIFCTYLFQELHYTEFSMQLLLMPMLAPLLGEQKLLSIGLFACWTHVIFFCTFSFIICFHSFMIYYVFIFIENFLVTELLFKLLQIFLYALSWSSWVLLWN